MSLSKKSSREARDGESLPSAPKLDVDAQRLSRPLTVLAGSCLSYELNPIPRSVERTIGVARVCLR